MRGGFASSGGGSVQAQRARVSYCLLVMNIQPLFVHECKFHLIYDQRKPSMIRTRMCKKNHLSYFSMIHHVQLLTKGVTSESLGWLKTWSVLTSMLASTPRASAGGGGAHSGGAGIDLSTYPPPPTTVASVEARAKQGQSLRWYGLLVMSSLSLSCKKNVETFQGNSLSGKKLFACSMFARYKRKSTVYVRMVVVAPRVFVDSSMLKQLFTLPCRRLYELCSCPPGNRVTLTGQVCMNIIIFQRLSVHMKTFDMFFPN